MILLKYFSKNSTKTTVKEFLLDEFSRVQPAASLKVGSIISILADVDEIV